MTDPLLVVRSRRVVTDTIAPAAIHVRAGRIERVAAWDDVPAGARLDDASLGTFAPGRALLSTRHETQYSRLFRS